jgi:hypothetical protein
MPRFMSSASRGYRAFNEGREKDAKGNTVIQYDINDTRHMVEIIGLGMGYQPLRLTAQWDRRMAEMEATAYWDIRRQTVLNQLWAARQNPETYQRVLGAVRKFNEEVQGTPARGKALTGEVISRSFQTRARAGAARESGVPRNRADIPIVQEMQRLYPEAEIDVRRTK